MMCFRTCLLFAAAKHAASVPIPPLSGYKIVDPDDFHLLRRSGESSLYETVLPSSAEFSEGRVLVANLTGDREEIGRAYAELLGEETMETWNALLSSMFGKNPLVQETIELFADWLWNKHYSKYVPEGVLRELDGMRKASPKGQKITVDRISRTFNVLANMPADPQNIIAALENVLEKGMPAWEAELINRVINHLDNCDWCVDKPEGKRVPFSPGCDAFGVWGSRTSNGGLFTSRNLDWNKDLGINKHKLVIITHLPDVPPYASFGFASGFGALAGMSSQGITVSEMNLDNSLTTFDGPPFPLRLRMVMEGANDLKSARTIWEGSNNTDSMNFLIGSAKDGKAMAIEAMRGYSGFFTDNDPVEAAATCDVAAPGVSGKPPGTCGSGFNDVEVHDGKKSIGSPLKEAVWRTNHAVDPQHMPSQEPLFNDTTFRYTLLHDLFAEHEAQSVPIQAEQAVSIAASLGIKGPDFLSCDSAQYGEGSNILSAVYMPEVDAGAAYVAWEDGAGDAWVPAACTTYVRFDLSRWWGHSKQHVMV